MNMRSWDANVLLSYINGVADRVPVIEELFRQARAGEIELLTSSVSRVEVAFAAAEKHAGALDPETEGQIDTLWTPGSPVKTVEFYDLIGDGARALIRQSITQAYSPFRSGWFLPAVRVALGPTNDEDPAGTGSHVTSHVPKRSRGVAGG